MASSRRIGYIAATAVDPSSPTRSRRSGAVGRSRGDAAEGGRAGSCCAAKILDPGRFAMIHPRTSIARAAGAGAILLLALLLPVGAARAQTSDVFEVRDVDVDVTADSAAAARDKAVLEGQRAALDTLLGRIASKDDAARL